MWMPLAGVGIILFFFAWMGRMEQQETGVGWARAGLKYMLWAVVIFGGMALAFWAWEGLRHTR